MVENCGTAAAFDKVNPSMRPAGRGSGFLLPA
jgi:hypothetical protein